MNQFDCVFCEETIIIHSHSSLLRPNFFLNSYICDICLNKLKLHLAKYKI